MCYSLVLIFNQLQVIINALPIVYHSFLDHCRIIFSPVYFDNEIKKFITFLVSFTYQVGIEDFHLKQILIDCNVDVWIWDLCPLRMIACSLATFQNLNIFCCYRKFMIVIIHQVYYIYIIRFIRPTKLRLHLCFAIHDFGWKPTIDLCSCV